MRNARLDEAQAGIKIAGRNVNNLRYADVIAFQGNVFAFLIAESKEELKNLLMKVEEKNEKSDLKLNIQKTKIMASIPIISCKQMGGKWKQWQTLFSWASKPLWTVTAAMKLKDACSLEENL